MQMHNLSFDASFHGLGSLEEDLRRDADPVPGAAEDESGEESGAKPQEAELRQFLKEHGSAGYGHALYEDPESVRIPLLSPDLIDVIRENRSHQDSIRLAAQFVKDAVSGQEIRLRHMSGRERRARAFRNHWALQSSLRVAALLHCSLVAWEATRRSDPVRPEYAVTVTLQAVCCLVFLMDLTLKLLVRGKGILFRNKWAALYLLVVLLILLDVVVSGAQHVPVVLSRPLRPLVLLCQTRMLRRVSRRIAAAIPRTAGLALLIVIVLAMYVAFGVQMFGELYPDGEFADSPSAALTLFVLSTFDNWPGVLQPAMASNGLYAIYFVSYVVLTLVFTSLLVAVVFDSFKVARRAGLASQYVKQHRGLVAAFQLCDADNSGELDREEWQALLLELSPSATVAEANVLFAALDSDGSGSVDVVEFCKLGDLLRLDISRHSNKGALHLAVSRFDAWLHEALPQRRLRAIVDGRPFRVLVVVVILANTAALLSYSTGLDAGQRHALVATQNVFLGFFTAEMLFKVAALGLREYWRSAWNRFDASLTLLSLVLLALTATSSASLLRVARFFRPSLLRSFRVLRVFLVSALDGFALFTQTVAESAFVLLSIGSVIALQLYLYAAVSVLLFPDAGSYFHSFESAVAAWFQVLLLANWAPVMYSTTDAYGSQASIIFVLFYASCVVVALNLLLAQILETFTRKRSAQRKISSSLVMAMGGDGGELAIKVRPRAWSGELDEDDLNTIRSDGHSALDAAVSKLEAKLQAVYASTCSSSSSGSGLSGLDEPLLSSSSSSSSVEMARPKLQRRYFSRKDLLQSLDEDEGRQEFVAGMSRDGVVVR